ncbi:hypothetical protein Tco_0340734 [Tanacetum coccineum]
MLLTLPAEFVSNLNDDAEIEIYVNGMMLRCNVRHQEVIDHPSRHEGKRLWFDTFDDDGHMVTNVFFKGDAILRRHQLQLTLLEEFDDRMKHVCFWPFHMEHFGEMPKTFYKRFDLISRDACGFPYTKIVRFKYVSGGEDLDIGADDDLIAKMFATGDRVQASVGIPLEKQTEAYRDYFDEFQGLDVLMTQSPPIVSTQGTHRTLSAPRPPKPQSISQKKKGKLVGELSESKNPLRMKFKAKFRFKESPLNMVSSSSVMVLLNTDVLDLPCLLFSLPERLKADNTVFTNLHYEYISITRMFWHNHKDNA